MYDALVGCEKNITVLKTKLNKSLLQCMML